MLRCSSMQIGLNTCQKVAVYEYANHCFAEKFWFVFFVLRTFGRCFSLWRDHMRSLVDEVRSKYAYSIDIHGLCVSEAQRILERTIINLNRDIREVVVIHGYSHGNSLQQMVRKDLRCKRIREKVLLSNPGRTLLIF